MKVNMIPKTEEENRKRLSAYLNKKFASPEKRIIILMDADRTIFEVDTSRILIKKENIDLREIKNCFKSGYTYEGFYLMNRIYSKINTEEYLRVSKEIAENVEFYPGFKSFIKQIMRIAKIIIISSGIKAILDYIFALNNLSSSIEIIGGTHFQLDEFLIGKNEKGFVCDYFKNRNKLVIAFGDSDVDSLMLKKADHAVVVVNHKNNIDLINNIKDHPSLSQISFKGYFHPNIPKVTYSNFLTANKHLFN